MPEMVQFDQHRLAQQQMSHMLLNNISQENDTMMEDDGAASQYVGSTLGGQGLGNALKCQSTLAVAKSALEIARVPGEVAQLQESRFKTQKGGGA